MACVVLPLCKESLGTMGKTLGNLLRGERVCFDIKK